MTHPMHNSLHRVLKHQVNETSLCVLHTFAKLSPRLAPLEIALIIAVPDIPGLASHPEK